MAQADKTFYQKFLAAQAEMPKLVKDSENPYFSSKYVSLDEVLNKVLPILNKNGLCLYQTVTACDGQPGLCTVITDGTDRIEDVMYLMMKSSDPQGQGSAITYARRYSLMSILGLSTGEDDDGNSANEAENRRQEANRQQTSPTSIEDFFKLLKTKGIESKDEAVEVLDRIEPNWKKLNTSGATRLRKELTLSSSDTLAAILAGEV